MNSTLRLPRTPAIDISICLGLKGQITERGGAYSIGWQGLLRCGSAHVQRPVSALPWPRTRLPGMQGCCNPLRTQKIMQFDIHRGTSTNDTGRHRQAPHLHTPHLPGASMRSYNRWCSLDKDVPAPMRTSPGMALMAYRSSVPTTASSPIACSPSEEGDSCNHKAPLQSIDLPCKQQALLCKLVALTHL